MLFSTAEKVALQFHQFLLNSSVLNCLLCKNVLWNARIIWGLADFSISEKNLSGVEKRRSQNFQRSFFKILSKVPSNPILKPTLFDATINLCKTVFFSISAKLVLLSLSTRSMATCKGVKNQFKNKFQRAHET